MPIKTVEVICLPCPKCEGLEKKVCEMVNVIGMRNHINIPFEFTHTKSLRDITRYSLNPAQTPVILINGNVEFAGRVDVNLLRGRLETVQKNC